MSDTTLNLFENIMLKSVKMHFTDITGISGVLKVHSFFTGFRIHFLFKL